MFSAINAIIDDSSVSVKTKTSFLQLTLRQQSVVSEPNQKCIWEVGLTTRIKTCFTSQGDNLRHEGLSLLNTFLTISSETYNEHNNSLCQNNALFWLRSCLTILESKKKQSDELDDTISLCLSCISLLCRLSLVPSDVDEMARLLALPLIDELLLIHHNTHSIGVLSALTDAIKLFPNVATKLKFQIEQFVLAQVVDWVDEAYLQMLARCLSQLYANNLRSETLNRSVSTLDSLLTTGMQLNHNANNSPFSATTQESTLLSFPPDTLSDDSTPSSTSLIFTRCLTFIRRIQFTSALIVHLLSQSSSTLHVHVIPVSRLLSSVSQMFSLSSSSTSLDSSLQSMAIPLVQECGLHILESFIVSCKMSSTLHASMINSILVQSLVSDGQQHDQLGSTGDKLLRVEVYKLMSTWCAIGGLSCGWTDKQVDSLILEVMNDSSSLTAPKLVKLKPTSNRKGKRRSNANNFAIAEQTSEVFVTDSSQLSVYALGALRSLLSSISSLTRHQLDNIQTSLINRLLSIYVDPESSASSTMQESVRLQLLHVLRTTLFHPNCIDSQLQALEPSLLLFSDAERMERCPRVKQFATESLNMLMRAFVHPKMAKVDPNKKISTEMIAEESTTQAEEKESHSGELQEEKVIDISSSEENSEIRMSLSEGEHKEEEMSVVLQIGQQEREHEVNEQIDCSVSLAKKLKEDDKLDSMLNDFVDE